MQRREEILQNLQYLRESSWAYRLEAIEFLKDIESKDEVLFMHENSSYGDNIDFVKDLNQIYEYGIKFKNDVAIWEACFYSLFEIQSHVDKNLKEYTNQTIDNLIVLKMHGKSDGIENQRPELVYSLVKVWNRSDDLGKFEIIKKVVKFKLKEMYNLVPDSLDLGEEKLSIKIARSLVQVGDKSVLPLLEKWVKKGNEKKKLEAIISLGVIGGIFETRLLYRSFLKEKGKLRCEACTSLVKILPFGIDWILRLFWKREKEVVFRKQLLQNLVQIKKPTVLKFLKELLLSSEDNALETNFSTAISQFSTPQKVKILTKDFDELSEEQKVKILVAIKGRPYPELEAFYQNELSQNKENPIICILILESLGHFQSASAANILYQYLRINTNMTVGYAFAALVKAQPELAADFFNTEFFKRESKGDILIQSFLKSIPLISPYLVVDEKFRDLLKTRYQKGSLNEKMFIIRSLPHLLDTEIFEFASNAFLSEEDATLKKLLGINLIKCCFIKSELLSFLVPLMDSSELVMAFKMEKIKTSFVENMGLLLVENVLEETLFVQAIMKHLLEKFLVSIDKFEIPAVVLYYFKKLEAYPDMVQKEHVDRAKAKYFGKGNPYVDEAVLEFSLLSKDTTYLNQYLSLYGKEKERLINNSNLQYCIGGER